MPDIESVREDILVYILTEFPADSPVRFLEDVVKDFLKETYSSEWIEGFWEKLGDTVIQDIVEEFNSRTTDGFPIHFWFLDDEGRKIQGWNNPDDEFDTYAFQQALLMLTDGEFEKLSGRILSLAGCEDVWVTPATHDQGLDAFGCRTLFGGLIARDGSRSRLTLWLLAQAKHYRKERIRSSEIREFVGSKYLAQFGMYAQIKEKYGQLDLKPLAPIGMMMITSGETKRTARLLGDQAGIMFLGASELCSIFSRLWQTEGISPRATLEELVSRLRIEANQVPSA